jgi:hypothetical protein
MKAALGVLTLAACIVSGCGSKTPPAEGAHNPTSAPKAEGAASNPAGSGAESESNASGDDASKVNTGCGGVEIPDLLSLLAQAACEVPNASPNDKLPDLKDVLEVKVTPPESIAPGGHADVVITFKNTGKAPLKLDFVVDPEARFDFELYNVKNTRADLPAGPEPKLPKELAEAAPAAKRTARVTLATRGMATVKLGWDAVKMKWAPSDRAKGGIPGRGYPKVPGGPLPKGKYVLKVLTPLTDISQGGDRELSIQKVPIVVGP